MENEHRKQNISLQLTLPKKQYKKQQLCFYTVLNLNSWESVDHAANAL